MVELRGLPRATLRQMALPDTSFCPADPSHQKERESSGRCAGQEVLCLLCQQPAGDSERHCLVDSVALKGLFPREEPFSAAPLLGLFNEQKSAKVALPTRGLATRRALCDPHTE